MDTPRKDVSMNIPEDMFVCYGCLEKFKNTDRTQMHIDEQYRDLCETCAKKLVIRASIDEMKEAGIGVSEKTAKFGALLENLLEWSGNIYLTCKDPSKQKSIDKASLEAMCEINDLLRLFVKGKDTPLPRINGE